jgi:lipoprotein NlpI
VRRLLAFLLLLAAPALAQDGVESFDEAFAGCTAAKAPAIVLVASCGAAIESGRLLPRGLAHAHLVRGFAFKELKAYQRAEADYDRALAYDPAFLPAITARADLFAAQRQYGKAIAELDRVIHADPDRAETYKRRGHFQDWKGDHDAAIADYTRALEKGGGPRLHADRGAALANKGETAAALAEIEAAIAGAPDYPIAWFERGRIRFEAGEWDAAAADFAHAAELDPEDAFKALWRYLAAARAGAEDAEAKLAEAAAKLDLAEWPGPLVEVYLGRRAPAEVDETGAPEGWERTGRRVEIEFYLGMLDLLRGDAAAAAARLRAARALGIVEFIEHRAALAELARLEK